MMTSKHQLGRLNEAGQQSTQAFVSYTNMKVETTSTPYSLCCVLQGLTDAQNSDIRDMGFESIKSFNIHSIPARLGYWLLTNYDHKRNELKVGNRIIKITPSKVHDVFGVPMGKIRVSEKRKSRKLDVIREEWRKQFQYIVTVKHVIEKLRSYREGGRLFKSNFLVVFNSIIGKTTKSATVNQNFLASIMNEGDISNMDWCSYLITCLKRTKEEWNGTEPYNGPLTFLAVLYAHEHQLKHNPDYAVTPALQYVTTDHLLDLESFVNDAVEMENQLTQIVEAQALVDSHIEYGVVQTAIDQNANMPDVTSDETDSVLNQKLPIGPPGAQSLSGSSANLGHCNQIEPPKDVVLIDDDDDVVILDPKKEQCELMEKFLSRRSDTVCVQGYRVNRRFAKTFEAIYKKHGDIAAKCVFETESFRSPILEPVCEVAQWIQNSDFSEKLEEIEKRISDAKAVNVDVSWLQAHLEAIRKRQEAAEMYKLLMEMKANIRSAKKSAQINLGKRRAELVAVQERSKEAKRCVGVLHLVGEKLIDNFFETKAKMNSWVKDTVV